MPDEFIHIYRVRLLNHVEVGIVILTLNNNGDIQSQNNKLINSELKNNLFNLSKNLGGISNNVCGTTIFEKGTFLVLSDSCRLGWQEQV